MSTMCSSAPPDRFGDEDPTPGLLWLWNGADPIITKEDMSRHATVHLQCAPGLAKAKTKLITLFRVFRNSELGQDLAEYCLITALIALAACGIFYQISGGMQGIWTSANSTLATSSQPTSAPAGGGTGSGDVRPSPAASPNTPAR